MSGNRATSILSAPQSRLGPPKSCIGRKSILKKESLSETFLRRSVSQQMLLQHADAIFKVEEAENGCGQPPFLRPNTDLGQLHHWLGGSMYSSGDSLTTLLPCVVAPPRERRHVHFNTEVVQCVAIESKYVDGDELSPLFDDEPSSDDSVVTARHVPNKESLGNYVTPCSSFSGGGETIAILPSATLPYCGETPEPRVETAFGRIPTISTFFTLWQWLSRSNVTS